MTAPVYLCPRCDSVVEALFDGRLARHPAADGLPCIDTDSAAVRRYRRAAVRVTLTDAELRTVTRERSDALLAEYRVEEHRRRLRYRSTWTSPRP